MGESLVGRKAPDFTVTDQFGRAVTLSQYRDKNVLLVFVPFAFSVTCSSELAAIKAAEELRSTVPIEIFVMSCDSLYTLQAWGESEDYPGVLLTDFWPHGEVARSYGVFDEVQGQAIRGSFLIDTTGTVVWSVVNQIGEARRVDDYLAALAALGA